MKTKATLMKVERCTPRIISASRSRPTSSVPSG